MFDNTGNVFLFNYHVQLDDVIGAVCDISFDIGKQLEEVLEIVSKEKGFSIIDLFKEDFLKEITTIRMESLVDQTTDDGIIPAYTNEEFFSYIADHYNKALFYDEDFLKALIGSDLLLIDKETTNFLGIGEKAKERLIPALKSAKILKKLIENLKSEKVQRSLQKIDTFENEVFYRNTIRSTKMEGQPLLPYLNFSLLNTELIETGKVDRDNYWINNDAYLARGIDLTGDIEFSIVKDKESKKIIGLQIKDYLLPYANVDLVKYVINGQLYNYYWLLIKYAYSSKPTAVPVNTDNILMEFKALISDTELNQLLSNLKSNFYIKDKTTIKEKFSKFFNDVVLLERLESLESYSFLMSSNIEQETALGVYNNDKIGASYNLLHWLNHKGEGKVNHFRTPVPVEKSKTIIHSLKPAICYYFLEKYFEDLFEHILTANNYSYLANRKLLDKAKPFCEIDFLVRTENKFFYFENKTKLSKFYIDEFLKKSSKMMDKFKPMIDQGVDIEFVLVGGYSDSNVGEYQYFITNNEDKGGVIYNTTRENLSSKPYYFTVPIPDKEGKQITCIAEPEYNNLQNLILSICQK